MIPNFKKVNSELYRGGAPSVDDVVFLNRNLGVSKIVSLDYDVGKKIERVCRLLGIKHITLPIEIEKKSSLLNFLKHDIEDLLSDDDGAVFIGCRWGKDRTGLAIALYRIQHDGWSAQKAIDEAKSFGFGIGVPNNVVKLYLKIIRQTAKNEEDINHAYDIVSNQREYPSDYADYTLGPWEQQSWSPFEDYRVREFPYANTDIQYWEDQYDTRQTFDLNTVPDHIGNGKDKEIPQSGMYDGIAGLNGFGPNYMTSGYI